ncbi:MAG: hypothetical protein ABSC00_10540 [Acidimicrobiales bacterium]
MSERAIPPVGDLSKLLLESPVAHTLGKASHLFPHVFSRVIEEEGVQFATTGDDLLKELLDLLDTRADFSGWDRTDASARRWQRSAKRPRVLRTHAPTTAWG